MDLEAMQVQVPDQGWSSQKRGQLRAAMFDSNPTLS
jgi:hypothetical protein